MTRRAAPAKVNLYLHVGPPAQDGYHPLASLAVFARDVGDALRLDPADSFTFAIEGSFAAQAGDLQDNLVVRAVMALAARAGSPPPPFRLTLDKQLPVAAGLGGGTSDAAAALRLVRDAAWPGLDDAVLLAVITNLAADGPMCLGARAVIAEGRGERLSAPPRFPDLPAVLVNPGVTCPTPTIFRAYDRASRFGSAARGALAQAYTEVTAFAADLAGCRNDLEAAARAHDPRVGQPLDLLAADPRVLMARLSGSGATSFALCADPQAAQALAAEVADRHPRWWTRVCTLGGAGD